MAKCEFCSIPPASIPVLVDWPYCYYHSNVVFLILAIAFSIISGLFVFVLGLLPSFVGTVLTILVSILPQVLTELFPNMDKDVVKFCEPISFAFTAVVYRVGLPFLLLSDSWFSIFAWQILACFVGIQICVSHYDSDDKVLKWLFAGVVIHGLLTKASLDWQVLLPLLLPLIRSVFNVVTKNQGINDETLLAGALIVGGYIVSILPKPLNEIDIFVVNSLFSYSISDILILIVERENSH